MKTAITHKHRWNKKIGELSGTFPKRGSLVTLHNPRAVQIKTNFFFPIHYNESSSKGSLTLKPESHCALCNVHLENTVSQEVSQEGPSTHPVHLSFQGETSKTWKEAIALSPAFCILVASRKEGVLKHWPGTCFSK